jgi:hypothetical protein
MINESIHFELAVDAPIKKVFINKVSIIGGSWFSFMLL